MLDPGCSQWYPYGGGGNAKCWRSLSLSVMEPLSHIYRAIGGLESRLVAIRAMNSSEGEGMEPHYTGAQILAKHSISPHIGTPLLGT